MVGKAADSPVDKAVYLAAEVCDYRDNLQNHVVNKFLGQQLGIILNEKERFNVQYVCRLRYNVYFCICAYNFEVEP